MTGPAAAADRVPVPARPPRRIVFTADFLRASPYHWRPTQHFNALWLKQLFGESLRQATGLPSELMMWDHDSVAGGGFDAGLVAQIYDAFGVPRNIHGWVRIFNADRMPPQVEALILSRVRDALVVGFEMPPFLEALLTRHGIPFVDVINHPVRFLDDIMFGLRGNLAPIDRALAQEAVSEDWLRLMAGIQAAAAQRLFRREIPDDSALFLMQMEHDRSQVDGRRFVKAVEFMDRIAGLAARHERLFVKTHPLQPRAPQAMAILGAFPNAEAIDANFYTLAATSQVRTVAALSSSTITEAAYFGKAAEYLFRPPYRFARGGDMPSGGDYVGVYHKYLEPDFWRRLLREVVETTPEDGMRVAEKPNRLRLSLREFWNFNEIDTDFAVEAYLRAHPR
ncbi:hypothetical protein ROJ8625_01552 [Roseivivax jejudonensis]|uniref:Capsule polysaccharide biosynthesis protein n=1 Tax=Roseivivax jejudonensis TaxID=1529041 RepID=A0A1X6YVW9_9RHOB|nr:hypothetical protein [Roseivivax jejudonensis]SLN33184.1 hypothetical protein ROJ8625_01552 [Roseivivax jejudonensis]